jgi:hypothetical protein
MLRLQTLIPRNFRLISGKLVRNLRNLIRVNAAMRRGVKSEDHRPNRLAPI